MFTVIMDCPICNTNVGHETDGVHRKAPDGRTFVRIECREAGTTITTFTDEDDKPADPPRREGEPHADARPL